MGDARWLIEMRQRRYVATKKAIEKLNGKPFTARDLLPKVNRELWSKDRWWMSVPVVVGALKRLKKEDYIEKVNEEWKEGRNKLYSSSVYRQVDSS
tara:strand:+ start:159 stop:446 length:288 start_codon:yes stop_codon:yes gene_type:complete